MASETKILPSLLSPSYSFLCLLLFFSPHVCEEVPILSYPVTLHSLFSFNYMLVFFFEEQKNKTKTLPSFPPHSLACVPSFHCPGSCTYASVVRNSRNESDNTR
mmetsp:Transcript_40861/g.80526  ORF Transcript_40861/g.80526 Transcript_40861/m.80526 type:complete len:104 (+) Transcript_40861:1174-1485(+)